MANLEQMYQCQTENCGYIYTLDKGNRMGKIIKRIQFENLHAHYFCY